jgi:hypothetical protein
VLAAIVGVCTANGCAGSGHTGSTLKVATVKSVFAAAGIPLAQGIDLGPDAALEVLYAPDPTLRVDTGSVLVAVFKESGQAERYDSARASPLKRGRVERVCNVVVYESARLIPQRRVRVKNAVHDLERSCRN